MTVTIYTGDCRDILKDLPAQSVHCCITSPPYWGLRDYGLPSSIWGADTDCKHEWVTETRPGNTWGTPNANSEPGTGSHGVGGGPNVSIVGPTEHAFCRLCGAWRGCLGLEPTPELYVDHLVSIFREVHRVLRDDGTVWLNLGDSYSASAPGNKKERPGIKQETNKGSLEHKGTLVPGLKPKDLCGIPWRVAFALQADGWWLRSDIIWHKTNPMPESVTDRPTSSHEHIFLLSKSQRYFYDHVAIMEPGTGQNGAAADFARDTKEDDIPNQGYKQHRKKRKPTKDTGMRNKRNVWTIPTKGYKEAHFATFPPDLIEPCIKAGTSEKGCCQECGNPLERETERSPMEVKEGKKGRVRRTQCSGSMTKPPEIATVGWQFNCDHHIYGEKDSDIPVSCTVLDPFAGAGTVGLVADRLGRDAILIELNPEYADMAHDRIKGDAPMFAKIIRR